MRHGLDPEHRQAFDAVFQRARRHASAAADGASEPLQALLLVVMLELEVELQRVLARLAWLEADAEKVEAGRMRARHPSERPFPYPMEQTASTPLHAPEDSVDVEDGYEEEQEAV